MPRQRQRARLENGLQLNINSLIRRGLIRPGTASGPGVVRWSAGDERVLAILSADMSGIREGWLHIKLGSLDQHITLTARARYFGGHQWYFVCPHTARHVSVLWMPPGARSFGCRQHWGEEVAYLSQCIGPIDRADRGQAKINSRLCALGGVDPDEWDLPPKPKWMRWRTYKRAEEKFDRYQTVLDEGIINRAARLLKYKWPS